MTRDRRTRSVLCAGCDRRTRHRSGRCSACRLPVVLLVGHRIDVVTHLGTITLADSHVARTVADLLHDAADSLESGS